ncbi:MAG: protein kinase, partial [bacterium]|nr:protein kinase [bacterium]
YMSPEQAKAKELDLRTDIWSLGVVLYEMVTGGLPFKGDNKQAVFQSIIHESPLPPAEVRPHLPVKLEKLILKCLQKDRGHRYPSMQPLLWDLKKLEKSFKKEKPGTVTHQKDSPGTREMKERRQATVIFAEISGFNQLLEKLEPEEAASIMNGCFEILGDIVEKYGGKIDKITGSTLTALFGVPTAVEDAPKKAVNTAIEMRNRLYRLNREKNLPIPLDIRMGINSGLVIAETTGTRETRAYTSGYNVMGDTVNL